MSDLTVTEKLTEKEPLSVPVFGYEIIREDLLKDLLGKDTKELLYWAGKRLARKYQLISLNEVSGFFEQAGWGSLKLKSESKNEMLFELGSEIITERIKINPECSFQLEAGFLAQQFQFQNGVFTEAFEHPRKKGAKVLITVKWDARDKIVTD